MRFAFLPLLDSIARLQDKCWQTLKHRCNRMGDEYWLSAAFRFSVAKRVADAF